MKKFREKFVDACYKRSTVIVCSILAIILMLVFLYFDLFAIAWLPLIFLGCIYAIYNMDRDILEKNKLYLVLLSCDKVWDCIMVALACCFPHMSPTLSILFWIAIAVMIFFVTNKISKFFEKKLEK